MTLRENVKQMIEDCTSNLSVKIKHYTRFNQPVRIIDDTFSEMIGAMMNNTFCGGSGGGGWDQCDGGEQKDVSHVQSKFCGKCGKKVVFHATECPHCQSTKFKASKNQKTFNKTNPRDGRAGINAKSHFKHFKGLKEYRLTLTEPMTDNPSCNQYRIRYWVISKDSKHLNAYAKAQLESNKSNHINFQPLKVDFYLSNPILKFDGVLTVNEGSTSMNFNYFNPENQVSEEIPAEFIDVDSQTVIESKNFNKERGEWVRN
jgi:ribosomal protein L40E